MAEGSSFSEVLSPQGVLAAPLSSVGGKGATLARMIQKGIQVPDFFCVSSAAYVRHLSANEIGWPESVDLTTDIDLLRGVRAQIIEAPVPAAVRQQALEAYNCLCSKRGHGKVAVRSSGGEEDSASTSFAGQFSSLLGVEGSADLLDALKECWASYLSDRSVRYRAHQGIPLSPAPSFGVVVQALVFAEKAGVLFTEHPIDPDLDVSYIEANFGTGESVVGGLTTPDSITISRSTGEVVEQNVATKRRMTLVTLESKGSSEVEVEDFRRTSPVLTESEALEIFRVGFRIEQLMGAPQDVEWAFDPEGLWILQSRPLTAPGRKS
jgi:phosphoenolpyruvate synthase/pyruvate phosphate dikinase